MDVADIAIIEEQMQMLEQKKMEALAKWQGKEVCGFKLSCNRYGFWRAYSPCKDGQRKIIHIGRDPRKAEEKIKAWLKSQDNPTKK